MHSRIRHPLALAGAACALASCTGRGAKPPVVGDFAGTGRSAAPALLSIGTHIDEVVQRGRQPASVEPSLTADRGQLRTLLPAADRALAVRLRDLITTVGFFRIAVESNSYQTARADEVGAAQRAAVTGCTASATTGRRP